MNEYQSPINIRMTRAQKETEKKVLINFLLVSPENIYPSAMPMQALRTRFLNSSLPLFNCPRARAHPDRPLCTLSPVFAPPFSRPARLLPPSPDSFLIHETGRRRRRFARALADEKVAKCARGRRDQEEFVIPSRSLFFPEKLPES